MLWLDSPGFERRPVVLVEDHLYHTGEMLAAVAAVRPDLLPAITACAIDRPGPDTDAAIADWLATYPDLQIAALSDQRNPRLKPLSVAELASMPTFSAAVASLLRPGGLLVQDVHLETLPFIPADQWWQSIYVAATVRGVFTHRPPTVRLMSNKQGYAATFGRDLLDAGFDPRDVIDKSDVAAVGVPAIASLADRLFPRTLEARTADGRRRIARAAEADREELAATLDVLLWPTTDGLELMGRRAKRTIVRADSHEFQTWLSLVRDRIDDGTGLPVVNVGERIGPPDVGRAEATNLAARHIHALRARLTDPAAVVTAQHAYRFADGTSVGLVTRDLPRPSR